MRWKPASQIGLALNGSFLIWRISAPDPIRTFVCRAWKRKLTKSSGHSVRWLYYRTFTRAVARLACPTSPECFSYLTLSQILIWLVAPLSERELAISHRPLGLAISKQ